MNKIFPTKIYRQCIVGGRHYGPGDIALVSRKTFRELVAIFAADPQDRLPFVRSARNRSRRR